MSWCLSSLSSLDDSFGWRQELLNFRFFRAERRGALSTGSRMKALPRRLRSLSAGLRGRRVAVTIHARHRSGNAPTVGIGPAADPCALGGVARHRTAVLGRAGDVLGARLVATRPEGPAGPRPCGRYGGALFAECAKQMALGRRTVAVAKDRCAQRRYCAKLRQADPHIVRRGPAACGAVVYDRFIERCLGAKD